MIEFIISILFPIIGGLGVSEADVTTYVTNFCGYIYAILISILVLIVLLRSGFRAVDIIFLIS